VSQTTVSPTHLMCTNSPHKSAVLCCSVCCNTCCTWCCTVVLQYVLHSALQCVSRTTVSLADVMCTSSPQKSTVLCCSVCCTMCCTQCCSVCVVIRAALCVAVCVVLRVARSVAVCVANDSFTSSSQKSLTIQFIIQWL